MTFSGDGRHVRDGERAAGPEHRAWLGPALGAVVTLIVAALFLPHQTLWIDETTQLSGLTLSPLEVVRWLTHPATHDFGVPGDRMPFLSYWLGWGWSRVFGLGETSLRWFGATATAVAAALLVSAGTRAFGRRAGLCAGLFFGLSANVCVTAVEIRAYPLFLLTTAGTLGAVLAIVDAPAASRRAWLALGAWLVAGLYTHFYGALVAGVVVLALGVDALARRRPLRPLVVLAGACALAAIGLAPFLVASVGLSAEATRDRGHEVAQLLYRLVGHPATAVYPTVTLLLFAAAAALAALAAALPRDRRRVVALVALMLGAGLAVAIAANFLARGFTAAKVSYAAWTLPLIALVLGAALAHARGRLAAAALGAALLFGACEAAGVAELAVNGGHFAHGPHRSIQRLVDAAPRARTAVLHAEPLDPYATIYFPLRYAYGTALTQFVAARPGETPPLGTPLDLGASGLDERLAGFDRLVVVRSRTESARQLADQLRHGDRPFAPSPLAAGLEASPRWRRGAPGLFVSFVSAEVVVLDRAQSTTQ